MAVKIKFSHMKKVIVDPKFKDLRSTKLCILKKAVFKMSWKQTWSNMIKIGQLDQTWSNMIKLEYFINTLALVMWHHRDMRQIMQKALFHAHIDSFLVISVFYDHHYSSSNRDAITCRYWVSKNKPYETPSFPIKQTNKIK